MVHSPGNIIAGMNDSEIIFSVHDSPEGYEARALGYAIFTQADTMEELKPWSAMPFDVTSMTIRLLLSFVFISSRTRLFRLEAAS
jgi:hypothetical protein